MVKKVLIAGVFTAVTLLAASISNAQSVSGTLGTVRRGAATRATVYLTLPGGIHANSSRPGNEYQIPTVVRASSARGVKVGRVSYPRGRNLKFGFSETPINVYEGRVPFTFTVTVPQSFQGNTVRVDVSVRYQACTNEVCYPPRTKNITLTGAVR